MKGYENYRVHCRLKDLMAQQNITVEELHQKARVSRETISQLRGNSFKGVSKQAIARICGALGIGIGDLFELLPEDIWLPIRLTHDVTIHFGSRTESEPHPVRSGPTTVISRQSLGSWDFRTFKWISEYLAGLKLDIRVRFEEHITGPGRGSDPQVQASAQRIFADGNNHIVIASPVANHFAEEVVCHAYGVPPYNPQMRGTFPYGFVWDDWRQVRSSFGWQGQGKQFGIAALPSNRMVAPHVMVPIGVGSDGALILVYRVFQAPAQREQGDDDERVIICFLGYSGLGTLAAAQLATDPDYAAGLYPPARQVPRLRALACKTFCEPSAFPGDTRTLTEIKLIPEQKQAGVASLGGLTPKARVVGGKSRRDR
jgi:DNA-binding Xre family transcriptional regulator